MRQADAIIVGGGVQGVSLALAAARRGLNPVIVERKALGAGASGASYGIVHGGLRYLQSGAVKLVAENHHERRALASAVAPHLVNPLTFYLPVYRGGPHGATKLGAGVFFYSALSAFGDGVGRLIRPSLAFVLINRPVMTAPDKTANAPIPDARLTAQGRRPRSTWAMATAATREATNAMVSRNAERAVIQDPRDRLATAGRTGAFGASLVAAAVAFDWGAEFGPDGAVPEVGSIEAK